MKIPAWAILNTALLFVPIALGLFVFRLWFIPNPELKVPALFSLVVYYCAAIYVCRHTSGVTDIWARYKKTNPTWKGYLGMAAGWMAFAFLGFAAFYVSIPAIATVITGRDVTKEYKITSAAAVYRSGCRYELHLDGASPAIGSGFCVRVGEYDARWVTGSKVKLYGQESFLGFRFTAIGS